MESFAKWISASIDDFDVPGNVQSCSNAHQTCSLPARQLLPRQLTQTKRTGGDTKFFFPASLRSSFRLKHSFASAAFKKKERNKFSIPTPWFVLCSPTVVIASSEHDRRSVLSHCKQIFLEIVLFRRRPKLLTADLRMLFSRFRVQSSKNVFLSQRNWNFLPHVRDSWLALTNTEEGKTDFAKSDFKLRAF